MLQLLSHEKDKLAFFIMQSKENQALIFSEATMTHATSGVLIRAYRLMMENIK